MLAKLVLLYQDIGAQTPLNLVVWCLCAYVFCLSVRAKLSKLIGKCGDL